MQINTKQQDCKKTKSFLHTLGEYLIRNILQRKQIKKLYVKELITICRERLAV